MVEERLVSKTKYLTHKHDLVNIRTGTNTVTSEMVKY